MKKNDALTRYTVRMAALVALITTIFLPAGFFTVSYQYLAGALDSDVEITAAIVTRAIHRNPEMWQYEQIRLEELLARRDSAEYGDSCRIYTLDGTLVAAHLATDSPPYLQRSVELLDAGVPVAILEVSRPFKDILTGTSLAFLVGLLLGSALFLILRVLPLKMVRRAERETHATRNFLKDVIDLMPTVLIGTNIGGVVDLWNIEAEKHTGVESTEAQGKKLVEVLPNFVEGEALVVQAITEQEIQFRRRVPLNISGEERVWDILVYPLAQQDDKSAILHMDDVTEKIQIERVMIQTEKMMSVGGLAAGMAHEINNPLAAIMQNTQVIVRRVSSKEPKNIEIAEQCGVSFENISQYMELRKIPAMLNAILDSSSRTADIVQDMLSFSRDGDVEKSPVAIHESIDLAINFAKQDHVHYDFRKINVQKSYGDIPLVTCSATQIQQVLLNIIKNSAEAMADWPLRPKPQQLSITTLVKGESVRIVIEDNGPGMPKEVRKRVFEPFYTTKGLGVGTGLGLSISYFIVTQNHNGAIDVESTPNEGTKFTIDLPINPLNVS